MIWSYILVFLLAAIPLFELIAIVPIAIIGGLSPIPVAILGFIGNLLTVLLLIVFVDKVKAWTMSKRNKRKGELVVEGEEYVQTEEADIETEDNSKKGKRARALFDKYGLPGLMIIGPLIVGSHISAFMGMSFGSKRSMVTGWMVASLVLWTVVTAVAASYGVSFFIPDLEEDGFINRMFQ
jgi:Ca2+/H+ antiporter, TMEM165/GDT1 family